MNVCNETETEKSSLIIFYSDPAPGTSQDWYKGVLKSRFAYTIELQGGFLGFWMFGFLLPPNQIKASGEELWAAQRVVFQKMVDLSNDKTTSTPQPPTTNGQMTTTMMMKIIMQVVIMMMGLVVTIVFQVKNSPIGILFRMLAAFINEHQENINPN